MENFVSIADQKNQFIDVLDVRLTSKKTSLYVYYAFKAIIQNKIMVLMYLN
jgi:hypothetical protein